MKELTIGELRALIQIIAPLSTLCKEVEKNIHLELYHGTADLALRSYEGLRAGAATLTADAYIEALRLDSTAAMDERMKMSQILLAGKQLLAYLAAVTGVGAALGGDSNTSIQTAPHIIINTSNTSESHKRDVLDFLQQMTGKADDE